MPEPLPSNLPLHFEDSKEIKDAYSKFLKIEQDTSAIISMSTTHSHSLQTKLIRIRVLGYLIREAPSMKSTKYVADGVNRCPDENKIEELGEFYCARFICSFKRNNSCQSPVVSSHPSRVGFGTKKELTKAMLLKTNSQPQNNSATRAMALIRDNFRCVFSGVYDKSCLSKNVELKAEWENSSFRVGGTHCAYIIPYSINANTFSPNDKEQDFAGSVWSILACFGYEELPERLKGAGIHSIDNVMTLSFDAHDSFDALELWFEAIEGKLNTYKAQGVRDFYLVDCKTEDHIITFPSTNDLPTPNPDYLRLHAVCCRVAHMSGADEHINRILDDLEDNYVLSEDGSLAHLLSFALEQQMIF